MRVYLGHGASGSAATMRPHVDGLARRGVEAHTVPAEGRLPMPAERAVGRFLEAAGDLRTAVLGGQSYGGRVASMCAAKHGCAGLVLFSYPLHPPGRPETLRVAHWPAIHCPALFLSGEADPFARVDLLRHWVATLPGAELVTYPRAGHGLKGDNLEDALDRVAAFVRALA